MDRFGCDPGVVLIFSPAAVFISSLILIPGTSLPPMYLSKDGYAASCIVCVVHKYLVQVFTTSTTISPQPQSFPHYQISDG
jgi:hypothetical protein